jgi:hypothetical protein
MRFPPLLRRFILAALAMLLLIAALYIGLGWAIWTGRSWPKTLFGEYRCARLFSAYAQVMGSVFSGDRDGDGIRDGCEIFFGTDPTSPYDMPRTDLDYLEYNHADFVAFDLGVIENRPFSDIPLGADPGDMGDVLLQPGERRRIHARIVMDGVLTPFASGSRVRLNPQPFTLVASPGGTPSSDSLLIPVETDGSISFDLCMPLQATAVPKARNSVEVYAPVPIADKMVGYLRFRCAWLRQPLSPIVKLTSGEPWSGAHLEWPPVIPPTEALMVEAARDEPGAEWFPIYVYPPTDTSCLIFYNLDKRTSVSLKFRVVPMDREAGAK